MPRPSRPRIEAAVLRMIRCASAGSASALTSSGIDVIPAGERRQRLAGAIERQGAARRCSEVDIRVRPRGSHEPDDVVGDGGVDVDLAHGVLHRQHLVRVRDGRQPIHRMRTLLLVEDEHLVERLGIAHAQSKHETVELRLRERERALVFDGVLGGDDHERLRKRPGRAIDGHVSLLHGFEERGLGLGGRPVDLIGQDYLAHDGTRAELELLGLLVEDRKPGDVAGQQVGRELDAVECAGQAARQRPGEHRLAGARDVLDEQVALAQQRHERQPDLEVLAHDDALDVGRDALAGFLDLRQLLIPHERSRHPGGCPWYRPPFRIQARGWDCSVLWRQYPSAGSLRARRATTLDAIHPQPPLPAPREVRRLAMTDTVLQSFCERCGTRYTVEAPHEHPEPPPPPTKGLGRFKRKGTTAPAQPSATSFPAGDEFRGTFHFCLECRRYNCANCWNEQEGYCISCRPPGAAAEAPVEAQLEARASVASIESLRADPGTRA